MKYRTILILLALLLSIVPLSAQQTTECEDGFRLIAHDLGKTCVPENVQRVVTLENSMTEAVVTLGVQPVGVADIELYRSLVTIPMELSEDAIDVGSRREPNLEAITALNPDLIIAASFRVTENYEQLNAIAPTLAFAGSENLAIMSSFFTSIAQALNKEAEAEQILADMNQYFADAAAAVEAANIANHNFVLSQTWYEDDLATFRLYTDNAMPIEILTNIGLENAWDAEPEPDGFTVVGIETLGDITDASFLFITDEASAPFYEESPLWNSLPFVQSGLAYRLNDDLWLFGGPLSAQRLVDVVLQTLGVEFEAAHTTAVQAADAFPVTIEHQYGSTTITEAPQRVVAIGYTEQDFLLAVGVTPVAVRYWYGDEANTVRPWAQDKVEGEMPIVLNMTYGSLNYEAILDLQPDLISAVTSGITQEEYDLLSEIAPTIAQSGDYINFGMPWQEVMQMVGDAVGKSAEAETIVAETEALFADARAQNPEFEGKTVAVSYFSEGTYGFYTAQDSRGRFFVDLGFVVPDELIEIAGDLFYADVSAERVELLDQDLIAIVNLQFIEGGWEALAAEPLFSQLTAVQEGRVVYFDEQAENALGFSSPLSLAYALDAALPQLEAIFNEPTAAVTCEEGFRLFDHEYLAGDPICIPEDPQRILALEMSALEMVLLADKELVGTANWLHEEVPVLLPELAPALEGVADTGYPANLEAALLAAPDLILAVDGDIDLIAGAEIAPIVMPIPGIEHNWRQSMEFWSAVLGTQDQYAEMIANYDTRIAEFQAALADNHPEISVIGTSSYGSYMWLEDTAPGVVITDAGLTRPEAQALSGGAALERYGEERWIMLSEERLDLADADAIFVFTYATTDPATLETENAAMEAFKADPVWNTLSAVQAGNVYYVGPHWWRSQTYLLANKVLDDLFTHLTGSSAGTPALSVAN